jgi:pyrroloquinoline quinone (PQQ) biosynthesis protein C
MLLSLLGFPTTRHGVLALYNLKRHNPGYPGASHFDIGKTFARAAGVSRWRWEYHGRFDFASVARSIGAHLRRGGHPTLLSFGAIHKGGEWRCTHVAVAVGVTDELIELLDPLGSAPQADAKVNVWLRASGRPGRVRVVGNSYSVNHRSEVAVLRWAWNRARAQGFRIDPKDHGFRET